VVEALRRRPAVACATASVPALAFAWRSFLGGGHSPFDGDVANYHHPVTAELLRAWSEGRIPLWTDAVYFGFPYLADPQTAAWYPATLLVAALGPHTGYIAFLFLHSALALLGTVGLVRSHGGEAGRGAAHDAANRDAHPDAHSEAHSETSWAAGWAAGLTVALSGYFAHETQHPGLFAILAWIPTWLWTTHALFLRPSPGRVAAAALVLAMMIFAGTLQVLFGALIVYACYVAGLTAAALRERGAAHALRCLAWTAAAQALGLSLAAVSLLPAIAHLSLTARSLGMDYAFGSMGSVHPLQLLGSFTHSVPTALPASGLGFGGASLYLGALAVPLALVGLLTARRTLGVALALATGLLAWLALGRYGSLHPFLYEALPSTLGGLRGIGRAIGPASVCVALLAGIGLQRLGDSEPRARRLLGAVLALGLACQLLLLASATAASRGAGLASALVVAAALALWFASRSSPRRLQWGLAILVSFDLLAFGALDAVLDANPPAPTGAEVAGHLPALADIPADPKGEPDGRVLLADLGPRNLPLVSGFDGVGGYNPLVMLQYLDFVNLANHGRPFPRAPLDRFVHHPQPERPGTALFDAASIRYVVTTTPIAADGFARIDHSPGPPPGQQPIYVYENAGALPRAYLAYRTERAAGPEGTAEHLGDGFDGRRVTIVEGEAPLLAGPATITPVAQVEARPEVLHFDVAPERPSLLVVTDTWYPGWRAWVDGVESPVFRANAHFRGIAVPAGARRVDLRFEPRTFRAGAALSTAALLVILALAGGSGCWRRCG
jgi:hypothetical protein